MVSTERLVKKGEEKKKKKKNGTKQGICKMFTSQEEKAWLFEIYAQMVNEYRKIGGREREAEQATRFALVLALEAAYAEPCGLCLLTDLFSHGLQRVSRMVRRSQTHKFSSGALVEKP